MATLAKSAAGLSPRGRGNLQQQGEHLRWLRSIPAWAGNLVVCAYSVFTDRSIPAWAGEPSVRKCRWALSSVYPRVGGGTFRERNGDGQGGGLSPRGRGNLSERARADSVLGSIPAWAGEPVVTQSVRRSQRVYPRVGGGTRGWRWQNWPRAGLSPRGRGNPRLALAKLASCRSIPAWAGEPAGNKSMPPSGTVYPRVGG